MIFFTNDTSATNTTVPFAEFWNTVSGSAGTDFHHFWWNMLPTEYFWVFPKDWSDVIDLPAYEKSIHGKQRGKLRAPKPVCPRGFKHLALRHEFSGPHYR